MKRQAVMIVIERDGRFLMGKRADWKSVAPGYWCPLSGGIEAGESEEEAVAREAFEEVGCKVRAQYKITESDTHDGTTRLHWWKTQILEGEPFMKNNEHSELLWVSQDELVNLSPSFPEDIEIMLGR